MIKNKSDKQIYFIDQFYYILKKFKKIKIYSDISDKVLITTLVDYKKFNLNFINFNTNNHTDKNNQINFDHLNNKNILVIGGAGSIGSEIVYQLSNLDCNKIVVADISELNIFNTQNKLNNKKIFFKLCDASSYESLVNIINSYKINYIFHCAANKHVTISENSKVHCLYNNIFSTINLIKILKVKQNIKMSYISTDKAVLPINIMGLSKRIGELVIMYEKKKNSKLLNKINIVRFGNVIGSSGSLIPIIRQKLSQGHKITVYGKKTMRYFMTINEAVFLTIFSSSINTNTNDVLFFKMGDEINIYDLVWKFISMHYPDKQSQDIKKYIELKKLNKFEKERELLYYPNKEVLNINNTQINIVDESDTYNQKEIESLIKNLQNKNYYFNKIDDKKIKLFYSMV